MTDKFSSLTRATKSIKTTLIMVAAMFINDSVENLGIRSEVFINNSLQFISKRFQKNSEYLEVNSLKHME